MEDGRAAWVGVCIGGSGGEGVPCGSGTEDNVRGQRVSGEGDSLNEQGQLKTHTLTAQ